MSNLQAVYTETPSSQFLPPDSEAWTHVEGAVISLSPTPLENQPTAYIQTSWHGRPFGEIDSVTVKAVCNHEVIALRLAWTQSSPNRSINDINVYADACAVLFPENGKEAQIETMGSPDLPVIGWYWRAGAEEPHEIRATGISTVERAARHQIQTRSRWSDGQWQVVLMRVRDSSVPHFEEVVPIGFALWSGANSERAGLKAYTPQFHDLILGQRP